MTLDPRLRRLLEEFAADEGPGLCASIEDALFELRHLEGVKARAAWALTARSVHTLKGSAASLELEEVARLAAALEAFIAPIQRSGGPIGSQHLDAILETSALIRGQLGAVCLGPVSAPA